MQIDLKNPKQLLKHTSDKIISRMRELLPKDLHKNGIKFLVYLMNTTQKPSLMTKGSRYCVVLPSRFLDNHFEGAYRRKPGKTSDVDQLLQLGFITRSNYSREQHLCREYKVDSNFLLKMMLHCSNLGLPLLGDTKNPVTNTRAISASPPVLSVLSQSLPTVGLLEGVLSYKYYPALYTDRLQQYILEKYNRIQEKQKASRNPHHKKYKSAFDNLMSDYYKYIYMLRCGNHDSSGTFDYKRNFVITSTGRIVERNGIQGLTRTAKAYVYKDLPRVFNYDLKDSQARLLSYYCKRLNIDCSWLDNYLNAPDNKRIYAQRVGISVDAWKRTLLSLIFGSSDGCYGSPYSIILKECGKNVKLANEKYQAWLLVTQEFRAMCKQWLTKLPQWCKSQSLNGRLSNACGVEVDFKLSRPGRKWTSAWLLQGLESAIIFNLMLHPNAAYRVISQEFDGLITFKEIPDSIFQNVIEKLGLKDSGIKLEIKPFV